MGKWRCLEDCAWMHRCGPRNITIIVVITIGTEPSKADPWGLCGTGTASVPETLPDTHCLLSPLLGTEPLFSTSQSVKRFLIQGVIVSTPGILLPLSLMCLILLIKKIFSVLPSK